MFSNFFIKRPIFAIVVSLVIVISGLISMFQLPIEQYPNMAPVQIMVTASYPGADAKTVAETVAAPIETQVNGVDNMIYMTSSSSSTGTMMLTVFFDIGTDPDIAQVQVQNRVNIAQPYLPSEVIQNGLQIEKRSSSILMLIGIYGKGDRYSRDYINNYANVYVVDAIKRVKGAGQSAVMGNANQAMRIWLNPDRMASLGITTSDINSAVANQNKRFAAGNIGAAPALPGTIQTFPVIAPSPSVDPKGYEDIIIRSNQDQSAIVRLKDVASVDLGSQSYDVSSNMNGLPTSYIAVYQQAGANALDVAKNVRKTLEQLKANFPEGLDYKVAIDTTEFVRISIDEVIKTLFEAVLLVIGVIYIFLQSFKSTAIACTAIVVALTGTFVGMLALGFTINLLTLFGLVLAIGLVVDDAIVVVEAVQSKFDAGYKSPYLATKDAMGDVTMAIISCTCVFMAVFIPVTFMGGTSGVFYTQFGITMATAVGISMISALTLCPALCAIMMRPSDGTKSAKSINGRVRAAYNASFNAVLGKYKKGVMFFIRHRWMVWTSLVAAIVLLVYLMSTTKTGLVPQEDQGVIMVNVSTSPGSTLEETTKVMDKLEDILKHTPEIEHYSKVAGYGLMSGQGTSYGTIIIRLKDWSERKGSEHTSDAVVARLNAQFYGVKEAQIFSFQPGMIPGYGMGNSLELNLQDRTGGDRTVFYESVMQFLGALNQRPEVAMAYTSYAMNFPQVSVDVDAAKCKRAGISPSAVLDALGSYCGGAYISNYNQFGKVYRVMMQASPEYRLDEQALSNMFVRNGAEMAPVSQFVTLNRVLGPETANRFNLYSAISANVNPAEGYSSGEVQKVIEEVAEQTLPLGYGYEYGGMAREEASTGGAQTVFIYAVCIFLIYLILACLYESFLVPFAVIFSVPFGLMGSFLFAKVLGLENNIYLQTGVIMLIGLLAKTAILITEYAIERRRKGMGIVESAYSAAQVRLRPILMTVLTMIFGMLPLMFSSGAGANGNSSLGTGVVGGMLVGTLALLFVVPVFYIIFEYLQEKIRPPMEEEADVQVLLEKQKSEAERAKN